MAARLKEAAARREAADQQGRTDAERAAEEERVARMALYDDLAAFGEEVGLFKVTREPGGVRFSQGERWLRFHDQSGGVGVDLPGRAEHESHRIYREPAMQGRWIWVRIRAKREDRLPLFDQGLEVLLVHALDLADPSEVRGPSPKDDPAPPVGDPDRFL